MLKLLQQINLTNTVSWIKENIVAIVIIVCLCLSSLLLLKSVMSLQEERKDLYELIGTLPKPEDYQEIKNQLSLKEKDKEELKEVIKYLESKKEEVKVITRTETILSGGKTEYVILPAEYIYKLNDIIPVANFKASEVYTFETYDLTFKSDIVISEKNTLIKSTVKSSASDMEYEIPMEISTTFLEEEHQEDKLFDPKVAIGIGASLPFTNPEILINVPLLESPDENFSFIAPSISISDNLKLGIIPVQYNIAKPIPLIDNLWLGIGYESDFINHYGAISLSAKL